ncbi:acylphosphatase-2 [Neocloeon triangulifer]|uniref:acylphosphatase-2 n=1 Tax=Neocloeon triangulifer TaxID=2078957 RepID=UPI00286ED51C|nr:acylphosphatase-2 [Neocloeon triangulifer]
MAVFTQTLWSQQQQTIYQQESVYLRQMGATDNLIQQANATAIVSVEFEVFGQVQGVYFTKYCRDMCTQLGIGGWVKNSKKGSIVGKMQGDKIRVDQMIEWLSKTGSPGCKIERCDVANWEFLSRQEFRNFSIRF